MMSLSLHKHRMSYLLSRNHLEWIDCSISSIQQRDGQDKTLSTILIFSPISIVIALKGNEIHEIEQYRTALKPFPSYHIQILWNKWDLLSNQYTKKHCYQQHKDNSLLCVWHGLLAFMYISLFQTNLQLDYMRPSLFYQIT